MKLYHGTSFEKAIRIALDGELFEPKGSILEKHFRVTEELNAELNVKRVKERMKERRVFLTPYYKVAEQYAYLADNPFIFEVDIPFSDSIIKETMKTTNKLTPEEICFYSGIPLHRIKVAKQFINAPIRGIWEKIFMFNNIANKNQDYLHYQFTISKDKKHINWHSELISEYGHMKKREFKWLLDDSKIF